MIVAGIALLAVVVLSIVLHNKVDKIDTLETTAKKQEQVEQSLRAYTGRVTAENDSLKQVNDKLKEESVDWQLKYYKCKRINPDDCEDEIHSALLRFAPDDEQGRILYDYAIGYNQNNSRHNSGETTTKRLVVQQ
jgi:hypothetical protein